MRWLDVAGPPTSGKSATCYPVWGDREVGWDGRLPPVYWRPFLDATTDLMALVQDHINRETRRPTIDAVLRMNDRSIKKMAAVERALVPDGKFPVFTQAGLLQRVIGFGWRLVDMGCDVNLIRPALWRMPVSVGVVFLEASREELLRRNRARRLDPATAHEDRSYQIEPTLKAIPIVKETLRERGIPICEINTETQSVDSARAQLLAFADQAPCHAASFRSGCEMETVRVVPPWFTRS